MAKLTKGIAYLKAVLSDDASANLELPPDRSPLLCDLGNGLCVAYVEDDGDRFRYLTAQDRGDLDQHEFHAQCVENLADIARKQLAIQEHGAIHAVLMGGNFEASLILVDTLWDRGLRHLCPNGFVAALPARDVLSFCDVQSAQGIAELRQVVARLQAAPEADHLLRPELFRRDGKSWVSLP